MTEDDEDESQTDKLRDLFLETTGEESITEEQEEQAKESAIESSGESGADALPKTKGVKCPECGNDEAHWYTEQTRAADEPATRFYICTECGHKWRDYD